MAYSKIGYNTPANPDLDPTNMGKMDQGIFDAHERFTGYGTDAAKPTPDPAKANRLYVVSGGGIYVDTGSALEFVAARTWTQLSGKPTTFPPAAHSHLAGDLPPATEAGAGIAEQATEAEIQAGTAGNLFATAARLKAELDRRVAPTAWTDVTTFVNGWTSFDATTVPRYSRVGEIVFVEGVVKKTSPAAFETIFTLPVGFRPGKVISEAVNASNASGNIQVLDTGEVRYVSGSAATSFYTVMTFRRA